MSPPNSISDTIEATQNGLENNEMRMVEDDETIRRAYFREGKSIREISRQMKHGCTLVRKAITDVEPSGYCLSKPRPVPMLGPYQQRIEAVENESDQMPRKQRYPAKKIYPLIKTVLRISQPKFVKDLTL